MRKIRLLSVVYGERYLDLFQRACLRSLWQPGNLPALLSADREIEHLVVTPSDQFTVEIPGHVEDIGRYAIKQVWYGDEAKAHQRGTLEWMKMCAADGSLAMGANPDWFFADGSVANMVNYLQDRDLAVAGLYARVNDGMFLGHIDFRYDTFSDDKGVFNVSPSELVNLAMLNYPHYCLSHADVSKEQNHSAHSGVFVQPISPGLWSMSLRVPNVILASVTKDDCWEYTEHMAQHKSGWWDWVWPTKLIEHGRLKFLQSSDLFFMVDLTKPDVNHPIVEPNRLWNDDFVADGRTEKELGHKARLHSLACKAFVGTLRGTQCK